MTDTSVEVDSLDLIERKVRLNMPLSLTEAALITGVSRDGLRKMVSAGRLKKAVIQKGAGQQRQHVMLLPKELVAALR